MSKFLPTSGFKFDFDFQFEFDLNKCTNNISKRCVLEIDLECPRELSKLQNYYPLAQDETEIKKEMLSSYQLKIANVHNIPIGTAKKLVSNYFDKEKYVLHNENLQLYLRLGSRIKKYIVY